MLNRKKIKKVERLINLENCLGKREYLKLNAFVHFEPESVIDKQIISSSMKRAWIERVRPTWLKLAKLWLLVYSSELQQIILWSSLCCVIHDCDYSGTNEYPILATLRFWHGVKNASNYGSCKWSSLIDRWKRFGLKKKNGSSHVPRTRQSV